MTTNDYLEKIRAAFKASVAEVRLSTRTDVESNFPAPEVGTLVSYLAAEFSELIYAAPDAAFTVYDLRRSAHTMRLETALGKSDGDYNAALDKISDHVKSGAPLTPPADSRWQRIALLARAMSLLEPHQFALMRDRNLTNAIGKLVAKGYELRINDGRIDRDSPGLMQATRDIKRLLAKVGLVQGTAQLFEAAGRMATYAFDQYLFGRRGSNIWEMRDPTPPLSFVLNLIVQLPDVPPAPGAELAWNEALPLAIDVAAVFDVETYDSYSWIGITPGRLLSILGDVGLHDHFFGMRQWWRALTPIVMRHVFTDEDEALMRQKYGWTVRDAALFANTVLWACKPAGTTVLKKRQLLGTRLSSATIGQLLKWFSHTPGNINQRYDAPTLAKHADFMFKPLIAVADGYLVPAASLAGPAFYEALHLAVRDAIGDKKTNLLLGGGTERVTADLLTRRGFQPTRENKTYRSTDGADAGECDLVLEDDTHVVFIECKAKAPTRGAMSGEVVDVLVDYAGSVLKSQQQALRHERVLTVQGKIDFDDGYRLELKGRTVTRLSVTLLDHGTLQDHMIFSHLAYPVLSLKLRYDPGHPRASVYDGVNEEIAALTEEFVKAEQRGIDVWNSTMNAASLSVGQLAVLLNESGTLSDLVRRLQTKFTFGTTNALLEYHLAKERDLFKPRLAPGNP